MVKKILIALLAILVIIQFIRPAKNVSAEVVTENDISKVYALPQDLHETLKKKCYDCHSNNTTYPWYWNFQPIAWWLNNHIQEGKSELNFSEFKTYEQKKALHKLEELGEVAEENTMPLRSYTILHPETALTEDDKTAIYAWLESMNIDYKKH